MARELFKPRGSFTRIRTTSSGRKVRISLTPEGRILDSMPVGTGRKRTKTRASLARRRRRTQR